MDQTQEQRHVVDLLLVVVVLLQLLLVYLMLAGEGDRSHHYQLLFQRHWPGFYHWSLSSLTESLAVFD